MAYRAISRLEAPGGFGGTSYGGNATRFRAGMTNPAQQPLSTRLPTGRRMPGDAGGASPGGIATWYSNTVQQPAPTGRWDSFKDSRGTKTYSSSGMGRTGPDPRWLAMQNRSRSAAFNEPDMPEFTPWEGERWQGQDWQGGVVDTSALIGATDALLKEKLGGEMSEAARRFGQLGALQSGGGLGMGYAGTLGESERGYKRDLSEITNRYRFQAEQADADRRAQAFQAAQDRDLRAYEGYEGRRFGGWGAGNDWKQWGYNAQLGKAGREQQAAIQDLLALYG